MTFLFVIIEKDCDKLVPGERNVAEEGNSLFGRIRTVKGVIHCMIVVFFPCYLKVNDPSTRVLLY